MKLFFVYVLRIGCMVRISIAFKRKRNLTSSLLFFYHAINCNCWLGKSESPCRKMILICDGRWGQMLCVAPIAKARVGATPVGGSLGLFPSFFPFLFFCFFFVSFFFFYFLFPFFIYFYFYFFIFLFCFLFFFLFLFFIYISFFPFSLSFYSIYFNFLISLLFLFIYFTFYYIFSISIFYILSFLLFSLH
jgi:hypothetical protein